jgi:hypothetical protein
VFTYRDILFRSISTCHLTCALRQRTAHPHPHTHTHLPTNCPTMAPKSAADATVPCSWCILPDAIHKNKSTDEKKREESGGEKMFRKYRKYSEKYEDKTMHCLHAFITHVWIEMLMLYFLGTSSDHKVTNANAALQATSRYESVLQQTVDSFKRHEGKQLPVYSGYSSFSRRSTRLITKRSYYP